MLFRATMNAIFLLILGLVPYSCCLKCYACLNIVRSDCANALTFTMDVVKCNANDRNSTFLENNDVGVFRPVCISAIEPQSDPQIVIRGCAVFPDNVDPCEYLQKTAIFEKCHWCTEDKCNNNELVQGGNKII
uniref:Uncharacterized protein n=1 Tax=Photinus pyralis TaxID=7054 RepID=A0A1Y1MHY2_PHOPY